MAKTILSVILTFLIVTSFNNGIIAQPAVIDTNAVIKHSERHTNVTQLATMYMMRYHYSEPQLNDEMSSFIFDEMISYLDHSKLYFTKEDIAGFEKYRFVLDQIVTSGNLEPVFDMFNVYRRRVNERIAKAVQILENEFDFSKDEFYNPDRKNSEWSENQKELDGIWYKKLKFETLSLKLGGKEFPEINETIKNRYTNFHKIILRYNDDDVFQLFMNAYTQSIDPHTNYFNPRNSDNFNINMSLSLEGIGATLTTENDYTTVVSLVTGGPAQMGGQLQAGDRIVAVAQGDTGTVVDVFGWRVDEVVQLIRGPKGTIVRLFVLPKKDGNNAVSTEIRIERDKIKFEEQSAKKKVIEIEEDGKKYKVGVISLPTFYLDFEGKRKGDPEYKSTTKDVKRLIEELNKENIDALIVDLRSNGGGSLIEAVDLTGLFIEKGPVVQVRNSDGNIEVNEDNDPKVYYSGPLAVLVNAQSASASEIFSGAIQDYGRGVVVGERTYGKGTVQNLVDLNRFARNTDDKLGQLTLTIAKYYRVDGSSTQKDGVTPDIEFPSIYDRSEFGESAYKTALPWDKIRSSNFKIVSDLKPLIESLKTKHIQRRDKNIELGYYFEDIERAKEMRKKKEFSLNYDKRKLESEELKAEEERRKSERIRSGTLVLDEKGEVAKESIQIDDPVLEETGHIVVNLSQLIKKQ
ncbi:MAG: carboxy terminal-processing peptidase [Ignavibacteriaceae bacterium]|nr:carboxy terminal-processing peptidase [Ignavibacteriaceae bacterium]